MSDDTSILYKFREEAIKPDAVYAMMCHQRSQSTAIFALMIIRACHVAWCMVLSPMSFTLTTMVMALERVYSSANAVT